MARTHVVWDVVWCVVSGVVWGVMLCVVWCEVWCVWVWLVHYWPLTVPAAGFTTRTSLDPLRNEIHLLTVCERKLQLSANCDSPPPPPPLSLPLSLICRGWTSLRVAMIVWWRKEHALTLFGCIAYVTRPGVCVCVCVVSLDLSRTCTSQQVVSVDWQWRVVLSSGQTARSKIRSSVHLWLSGWLSLHVWW